MNKKTLKDVEVRGKRVLVRADFNVPIEQGVEAIAAYDHRLRVTLPTIRYLLERNCKVVLCSHLGRPKGKVVQELRMAPLGHRLSVLLGQPVKVLGDCIGPEVEATVSKMQPKGVVLLENLRFHAGEEENDPSFAQALASLADLFVLDAFGTAHRAHASIVGIPKYLPSVAGLLLEKELEHLGQALDSPARPVAALIGGAKVADKILVLENLVKRVDVLLIGGGMCASFLKAMGHAVGASKTDNDGLEPAKHIIEATKSKGVTLCLPIDVVVASEFGPTPREIRTVSVEAIPEGHFIMDVGHRTVEFFSKKLTPCKTVLWNGPMGVFEYPAFAAGTSGMAKKLASLKAITIVGGGSTAEAVEALGLADKLTHVSSGGGATLEFLEGKELPGIAALPSTETSTGRRAKAQ